MAVAHVACCAPTLHDALPIWDPWPGSGRSSRPAAAAHPGPPRRAGAEARSRGARAPTYRPGPRTVAHPITRRTPRSEEHTSEVQSQDHIVCDLMLDKKKKDTH